MKEDYALMDILREQEQELADFLDQMIFRAEMDAAALDPRTKAEMHKKLPTEHISSRLRYLAYKWKRAREALL